MVIVDTFEAKTHFSSLLARVEKGEQVIITKYGHPIAKLVPAMIVDREQVSDAIKKLKVFSAEQHTLGNIDWKELRDEGCR